MNILPDSLLKLMNPAERAKLGKAGLTQAETAAKAAHKSEKEMQEQIQAFCDLRGWPCYRQAMHKRTTGRVGQPDFIICLDSYFVAIECKMPGNKLSPEQEAEREKISNASGWFREVHSAKEAIDFLSEKRRKMTPRPIPLLVCPNCHEQMIPEGDSCLQCGHSPVIASAGVKLCQRCGQPMHHCPCIEFKPAPATVGDSLSTTPDTGSNETASAQKSKPSAERVDAATVGEAAMECAGELLQLMEHPSEAHYLKRRDLFRPIIQRAIDAASAAASERETVKAAELEQLREMVNAKYWKQIRADNANLNRLIQEASEREAGLREENARLARHVAELSRKPEGYEAELDRCDQQIATWKAEGDMYGVNFHEGMRSGIIQGDIIQAKEKQALRADLQAANARVAELERERDELRNFVSGALHERLSNIPRGLNSQTHLLLLRFTVALGEKLFAAQQKYGYSDHWRNDDWMEECQGDLVKHVAKGDPRDVAAYCAFMWHHGWSTRPSQAEAELEDLRQKLAEAEAQNSDTLARIEVECGLAPDCTRQELIERIIAIRADAKRDEEDLASTRAQLDEAKANFERDGNRISHLQMQLTQALANKEVLETKLAAVTRELQDQRAHFDNTIRERDECLAKIRRLSEQVASLQGERDALRKQVDRFEANDARPDFLDMMEFLGGFTSEDETCGHVIKRVVGKLRADNAALRKALESAHCPDCDGSGAYPVMPDGQPEQCRWCFERNLLLTSGDGGAKE